MKGSTNICPHAGTQRHAPRWITKNGLKAVCMSCGRNIARAHKRYSGGLPVGGW